MEINKEILFIVLLYKNENLAERAPYDLEILGKKMWQWVALAGEGAVIKTTPCTKDSDIISLIKPFVGKEKYVFVAYSDTPLLTKAHVMEIMDYFEGHDANVLKLQRGFVFNADYLKNCESIMALENKLFSGEEFESVDSFEKLNEVTAVLQKMIIDYHISNGVQIIDKNATYIDADVILEKGVKIEPNNSLKGNTYIGENVKLEPNNIIKDSILSKNVIVRSSYISNSRISENMIVGPFETVIDKNV
ncbi:MAG: hypothetical protein E7376_03335 [Clostridiales bacterium]|nr:hypothetical protein [Clostridiales bacterium]